ncbi:hypothetical protein LFML04_1397 [Leptospirillum ferriphilum ML-04]|uniref:Uncharacterized protein n=1 Tax=Leptospirillum ferriphilum (strain ML-04) TaxID=1048260 RepID=J9ZAQ1_LEPFM|nr:hypothetical protein LFML04_1397 [Leptospirillum ferriphilum ML-04]
MLCAPTTFKKNVSRPEGQKHFVDTKRKISGFWQSKTGNAIRLSGGTGIHLPESGTSGPFLFLYLTHIARMP